LFKEIDNFVFCGPAGTSFFDFSSKITRKTLFFFDLFMIFATICSVGDLFINFLFWGVAKWQGSGFWYRHSEVRILPPQPAYAKAFAIAKLGGTRRLASQTFRIK
jgi:hypothetical protein